MKINYHTLLALPLLSLSAPLFALEYNSGNGHYYDAIPWAGTWQGARDDAALKTYNAGGATFSGHLATVTSADENNFIVVKFPSAVNAGAFLGGYQCDVGDGQACPLADSISEPAGGWKWVTGEEFSYTNWNSFEPNNLGFEHFLQYYPGTGGYWNDVPSTGWVHSHYILELEPPIVNINIKPGSDPNSINTCSQGATPVAIFGSDDLDVTTIDRDQLVLASAQVKTVGKSNKALCSYEDIGSADDSFFDNLNLAPDGHLDLVCHFTTYGLVLSDSSTEAGLTITGIGGAYVLNASDAVNIVKDCE